MLEGKPIEEEKKTAFKGFAEGRSKWVTSKRYIK
jgi:hypothetical protein